MKPDCGTTKKEPAVFRDGRLGRAGAPQGRRGERGQAITEFAMMLPLFAILVVVCITFGKALYAYIQLTHLANEGARFVAVDEPTTGTLCSSLSPPNGVHITISYPHPDATVPAQSAGEPVTVTADVDASWIPFIGIPKLTSSATMRLEQSTGANLAAGTCP